MPGVAKPATARGLVKRSLRAGNTNSLRHGVYSKVAVREEVLDECALIFARATWLDEIRDGPIVESTARLAVRLRKLDTALEEKHQENLAILYSRLEMQYQRNLSSLGLTPIAAAKLGIDHLDARERERRYAEASLEQYKQ